MKPLRQSNLGGVIFLPIAILIALFVLVSCGSEVTESITTPTIAVVDQRGVEIVLDEPATKIISMAPSNTEILFAIGAGSQMVGRDDVSDYPPEALDVESIGSTYGELNTEAIISLAPDLVMAADITPPEQITEIEKLGITVFQVPNPSDFDHFFDIIIDMGTLTGRSVEAEDLVTELADRIDRVKNALADADSVSVFYEVDGSDPTAPWTTGSGTFQDYMIQYVAGENIAADIQGWGQMTVEEIVARDPAVILFASGPWVPTTAETFAARAGWENLSAVEDGRIYSIDTNWIDRPGPRLIDALEFMAASLQPDRFP